MDIYIDDEEQLSNCAPLLIDLFLYSYEASFVEGILKKKERKKVSPIL